VVRNAWDLRKLPPDPGESRGVPGTVRLLGAVGLGAFVMVTFGYPVLFLLGRIDLLPGSALQLHPARGTVVQVCGAGLLGAGLVLAFWSLHAIRPGVLTTTGPYAFVRHPMYTGYMLAFAGLFPLTLNLLALVPLLAVPAQIAVARGEEASLEVRYGRAYRAYAARTGRFWPRVRRARA
jgi:protein-S-isoprenylcysteine O-methyltransferase Ste14